MIGNSDDIPPSKTGKGRVLMSLDQAREVGRNMWEIQGLTMPKIAELMGKSVGAIEQWVYRF